MASVYALVYHGTWEIGNPDQPNPYEAGTVDKVHVDNKRYSSKPPIMPLLMTAEFLVLRSLGGLDLNNADDRSTVLSWATITFITLPFILSGFAFWSILYHLGLKPWAQTFGVTALLWGTEYAGYAATINNHVPATACIILGIWGYFVPADKKDVQTCILAAALGITLALAVTIDLPSAVFVLLIIPAYLMKFSARNAAFGVAGFLIPVLIHCAIMLKLSGSPLPFQMNHDYYLYEESYWRNPIGIDALNHSLPLYLFNMTIGRVGLFIMYPVSVIGAIALVRQIVSSEARTRIENTAVLIASLILGAYSLFTTNNYGGVSFGFRWFIILAPFFLIPATLLLNQARSKFTVIIGVTFLAVSIFSSVQCRLNPWSIDEEWPTRIFGSIL